MERQFPHLIRKRKTHVTIIDKEPASAIDLIVEGFESAGYICDRHIATSIYLSQKLDKPILVEGPPGVGKTELAKAASELLEAPLIRLQCYEGLDESKALYEWKYGKQLLYTQILKEKLGDLLEDAVGLDQSMNKLHQFGDSFFSEEFLEARPLMQALKSEGQTVLLIDEIDKSDNEFEAYLLEILSDYQISVPEIGTIKAKTKPLVFLTSNNTREMSDALKRRCLHLYIPFPDADLERRIIKTRVPELDENLRNQLVSFVQQLRTQDLKKLPAVSETIDWARTLLLLHAENLDTELVRNTLNMLLKFEEDIDNMNTEVPKFIAVAQKENR